MAENALLEKVAALWIEFWTSANPDIDTSLTPERVALDDLVGWLKVMADNGLGWCEHNDGTGAQMADPAGVEDVIAVYGCVPSCDDMTKVRWIFRYVSQLPDPLRRKVIAKLSADYINDRRPRGR